MSDIPSELAEGLRHVAETLLATAEHCYWLARHTTGQETIEALLRLAEECEQRAEELQRQTEEWGKRG